MPEYPCAAGHPWFTIVMNFREAEKFVQTLCTQAGQEACAQHAGTAAQESGGLQAALGWASWGFGV